MSGAHQGPASGATTRTGVRIGEAARRIGVSASVLRLWERQGLVAPRRSTAGYRLYREEDLARLGEVRRMREEQVSAPGILRMLPRAAPERRPRGREIDGKLLRRTRRQRGLSLGEAARRAEISVSFLSALERNLADASLPTLHRLARLYDTSIQELIGPPSRRSPRRIRPADRPMLELDGSGVRIEQLALGSTRLEPQLFLLAPGATSEGEYAHAGEEFLYVLDGEVTFWIGADERYRLRTGDSLTFPSNLPHRWRNRAGGETRLLWINTPPTF